MASRAEKPCFSAIFCHFRPFSGQNRVFQPCKPYFCDFIKIKKNCHLICKISDIFCLAKYDLRWSWFFDFYYMGVQIFKPAELYQNVLQLFFFSFSQFIFSLSRTFFGCQRISIKHFVVFSHRLIHTRWFSTFVVDTLKLCTYICIHIIHTRKSIIIEDTYF